MRVADFDFHLPEERIAQHPATPRDSSKMLVLHKESGRLEDRTFSDIINYLNPGDVMVINDTRVIPARLFGNREHTGAKVEILLLTRKEQDIWECLVKPGKKVRPGDRLLFGEGMLAATVLDITEAGGRYLRFSYQGVFETVLDRLGQMPLPPYIKAKLQEPERYQTVYARERGSAAAPTAGLHFTRQLLDKIEAAGVRIIPVLLHVGLGTFRPVSVDKIEEHRMHAEYYRIEEDAAAAINEGRQRGNRIVAVGTTAVRCLETAAGEDGIRPGGGWTDIFIYPGYKFQAVDVLVTNFHLPRSTLLMLVSAFAGREETLHAYRHAVANSYRFFSFGDAMLII